MEGSTAYHLQTVLRLKGKLDQGALEFALNGIVNRHEVLRTVILGEDGKPYQHILPENGWKLTIIDDLIHKNSPEALRAGIKELTDAPFNLAADHMLRAYLLVLGEEEYVLLVTMHHIASDGWSMGIIVNELIEFYNASTEKRQAELPALEIQYADYAVWQRELVSPQVEKFHLDYWKKKLNGVATLLLPADYPRPAVQSSKGAVSEFSFGLALSEKLQTLARSHDATLFMTLLTAFKVLLYRYTGQDDICVGTPTAGRTQQELEGLVGFFVNTLALRSDLGENPSFEALLKQVKDTTLNAYQHQDLPLEKIVEAVVKERDLSRNPLFQVCFTLVNTSGGGDLKLQDVELSAEPMELTKIQFDFTLTLRETEEGLSGAVEYSTDLYREETISRMVSHLELLLQGIVANPGTRICDLEMLSTTEEQLLLSFNETAVDYELEPGTTLLDAFAIQVEYAPDAIAIVFEEQSLSYKELDERANQLAHYLTIKGVTTETLVPICLGRSLEMIIGIFGVLKAGAAYVPIDPDYPASRISYILEDTAASVIITDGNSKPKLPELADHIEVIALDEEWHEIGAHAKGPVGTSLTDENLAYVIYTSGSTGKPKGVLIEHNGVVNLAMSQRNALRLTHGTRFLQFASFGFDASCYEVFNTLLSGGVLVLPKKEDLLSAESFGVMVKRHQVEVVTLPPSYQHLVKDVLGPVTTVVSAGEPLNREDARYIKAKGVRVINAYGPTENTVCTSLTDEPILANNTVVIGNPIENVQVYIQSEQGRLCPVGVAGELCVGGPGVARGYLNRPELTAEKFIPDTYIPKPGARLYRTGDLARWCLMVILNIWAVLMTR
ncbi:non-ribosomal peptide synthetase [Pedobacter sp. NJ-S-72]